MLLISYLTVQGCKGVQIHAECIGWSGKPEKQVQPENHVVIVIQQLDVVGNLNVLKRYDSKSEVC